jgi:hypothetical protein
MHKKMWFIIASLGLGFSLAQNVVKSELVGFAAMPADTFAPGPDSGQFRAPNGGKLEAAPFKGQPVQGFSAIQFGPTKGSYWMMPDNGFGAKYNSFDAMLRLYTITPSPKLARVCLESCLTTFSPTDAPSKVSSPRTPNLY